MIRIEQTSDGRWRWVFTEPGTKVELESNEDYDEHAEAEAAARRAYPDAVVEQARSQRRDRGPREGRAEEKGGLAEKVARWLTPVVILVAWSRSKRRGG